MKKVNRKYKPTKTRQRKASIIYFLYSITVLVVATSYHAKMVFDDANGIRWGGQFNDSFGDSGGGVGMTSMVVMLLRVPYRIHICLHWRIHVMLYKIVTKWCKFADTNMLIGPRFGVSFFSCVLKHRFILKFISWFMILAFIS